MGSWRLRPIFWRPWKKPDVHFFRGAEALAAVPLTSLLLTGRPLAHRANG